MQDVTHHNEDDRVIVAFADRSAVAGKINAGHPRTRQKHSQQNTMDLAQLQHDRRTDQLHRWLYGAVAESHERECIKLDFLDLHV